MKTRIAIIMGSDSDLSVMSDAAKLLDSFKVKYELTVISAHRTPKRMFEYASSAVARGVQVIIAGAGGAAHVAGMIAALTPLPVIGVPIKTKSVNGLDSLLSIAQMPAGIPVATMAINNSSNAALFALRILALSDTSIAKKLNTYKISLRKNVEKKAQRLEKIGYKKYLQL